MTPEGGGWRPGPRGPERLGFNQKTEPSKSWYSGALWGEYKAGARLPTLREVPGLDRLAVDLVAVQQLLHLHLLQRPDRILDAHLPLGCAGPAWGPTNQSEPRGGGQGIMRSEPAQRKL